MEMHSLQCRKRRPWNPLYWRVYGWMDEWLVYACYYCANGGKWLVIIITCFSSNESTRDKRTNWEVFLLEMRRFNSTKSICDDRKIIENSWLTTDGNNDCWRVNVSRLLSTPSTSPHIILLHSLISISISSYILVLCKSQAAHPAVINTQALLPLLPIQPPPAAAATRVLAQSLYVGKSSRTTCLKSLALAPNSWPTTMKAQSRNWCPGSWVTWNGITSIECMMRIYWLAFPLIYCIWINMKHWLKVQYSTVQYSTATTSTSFS